ncbi:winged helix-turn-helix transcriptional regulator [Amycolatopsis alkalitolerans]|uniref:Winged helix-turn-helix transcriptional regulator n=1 Tax=Amycolatopsis alkalitolerans TaxID=2547244 RepID=A0A5C4M1G5_9PSEU|nr:winged helix-turn-helix transcriptional regulator [Amycolatopsis alkalitolerans]
MPQRPVTDRTVDLEAQDLIVAVPARLNRLHQMVLGSLDPQLTFRQYRTLSRVAGGYTSLSQLAARGNLSLPTVSENVDGLVRRGLLVTTQSEHDRRAIVLGITDKGRAAVETADAALRDLVKYLVADIPAEDLPVVTNALRSLYDRATIYFNTEQIDGG